uniref:Uncharacterized protein n=1 Tax=Anguilla anguilla TaxID=7936 RepID=A0A0E9TSB3_ANGAN
MDSTNVLEALRHLCQEYHLHP